MDDDDPVLNRKMMKKCAVSYPVAHRQGFNWVRNSCYLDSVLWVLFSSPIPFIDNKILFSRPSPDRLHEIGSCHNGLNDLNERIFLEFQIQFRKVAAYFRCGIGQKDCSGFRKLFEKWYNDPRCSRIRNKVRFHSGEQHEAQEFLQFILSLYGMNGQYRFGAVSEEKFHYGVSHTPRVETIWKYIYSRKDYRQSIVWNVPFQVLFHTPSQNRSISTFLTRHDEIWNINKKYKKCDFNCMKTFHTLIRFADFQVISLERSHPIKLNVCHYRVNIPPTLTDSQQKTLRLVGIICHHGEYTDSGHYTAYALSTINNNWYYYDDMNPPIQKIGGVENLQGIKHINSHGVLFFYAKI